MPFPPRGLKSQEHPLKHRFDYSFGLSSATDTMNSAWVTLVRGSNEATQANAKTILVNPKNASHDLETGPLCTPMSIVQNIKVIISFNKSAVNNVNDACKLSVTPFFASFGEKYEVADDDTGVTVKAVMQLTKDDSNEDIVPLTTNNLDQTGNSNKDHPVSTVNFTEVFGTYNMTTDMIMEDTPFDMEAFHLILQNGSNNIKGALKACLGRTRRFTFHSKTSSVTQNLFIKKFVPRAIRRILPFTYFGLLFHMPIESDIDSYYYDTNQVASKSQVGIRCLVRFDEWHEEHDNTM